jgi:hypothetical protein
MDDRRIAEWLSVDDTLGDGADGAEIEAPGGESVDARAPRSVDAEPSPAGVDAKASRAPPRARSTPQRRSAGVVGFEGWQSHVLELIAAVTRRIRRRPLAALAVGVGVGFVVGGALSFRTGRLLLAAGTRHVTRELLKQLL